MESVGGVVTVTDGSGRILTVQGDKETLGRARDSNMAPWSCWSEWATGTNGMGTALEAPGPVLISGPEHWCVGFDEWTCAGVAVRDAVTQEAVAVLDVSTWRGHLPPEAAGWLSKAVGSARAGLQAEGGFERRRDARFDSDRHAKPGAGVQPGAEADLNTGRKRERTLAAEFQTAPGVGVHAHARGKFGRALAAERHSDAGRQAKAE